LQSFSIHLLVSEGLATALRALYLKVLVKSCAMRASKDYWEALHPHSAGGAYVNFMMNEGQDRVRAAFRENYNRLAAIKRSTTPQTFSQRIRTSGRLRETQFRHRLPCA
jgi:hypothetical protein